MRGGKLVTVGPLARIMAEYPPETMRPGDIYTKNDPHDGGTHLPLLWTHLIPATLEGLDALAAGGFSMLLRLLPLGALAENAALDWTVFWAAMAFALSAAAVLATFG